MRPAAAVALFIVGMLVLAAGIVLGTGNAGGGAATDGAGLMFPGLTAQLQNAARVEITSKGQTTVLARAGAATPDSGWGLVARDGYPVQASKLHALLVGLTELRLAEKRTADPALYARLGVDDPSAPNATGVLLRVLDPAGKPIVALIVGHRRSRTARDPEAEAGADSVYVRRPDSPQSWLAEGRLAVDVDPMLWIDRAVVDIDAPKISGITAEHAGARLVLARKGEALEVTEPADHPPLDPIKLEEVGHALENLTFDDVRRAAANPGAPDGASSFTTADGLKLTVTEYRDGADVWTRFETTGTGAAPLDARLTGWDYKLAAFRTKALVPTLDSLKAPPPPPTPVTTIPPGSPLAAPPSAGPPRAGQPPAGQPPAGQPPASPPPASPPPAAAPPATPSR
jgi:hypothetical protein